VGSDLDQDGTLSSQPVGLEGGVDKKFMFIFEFVQVIRLDIGVLLPENVKVFALDDLFLLFKNTCVLVESTFFSGTEQQVCFTGALRVGYQNLRGYGFTHGPANLAPNLRVQTK